MHVVHCASSSYIIVDSVVQVQEEVGDAGRAALAILEQAGRREQRVTGLKLVEALQVSDLEKNNKWGFPDRC